MLKVSDIMSSPVITVDILDSVGKAARTMERHRIGGLPVLEDGKLRGIITSRDIRRAHPNRIVADAMSRNVLHVCSNVSLWQAINIINENNVERLPVLDNGLLVGILTKTDILVEIARHTDPLTGLKTGSYMRSLAENILAEGKEVTVIFFDIDDFGNINKTFGHVYGDRCLKIIGQVLAQESEEGIYFPGRYAGDEFIVITVEKMEKAREWTYAVLKKIEDDTRELGIPVTVAAGVAGGRRNGTRSGSHFSATVDDLINKASLASTSSKKDGRLVTLAG